MQSKLESACKVETQVGAKCGDAHDHLTLVMGRLQLGLPDEGSHGVGHHINLLNEQSPRCGNTKQFSYDSLQPQLGDPRRRGVDSLVCCKQGPLSQVRIKGVCGQAAREDKCACGEPGSNLPH